MYRKVFGSHGDHISGTKKNALKKIQTQKRKMEPCLRWVFGITIWDHLPDEMTILEAQKEKTGNNEIVPNLVTK